ncbi:MAG: PEGA domain-containing protein [Candidatus Methanocomedens sp.]|nr:MAG: PEGA domain-containing protein [ANME-2 cluster archaeon]
MKCPECGFEGVLDNEKFCGKCGANILLDKHKKEKTRIFGAIRNSKNRDPVKAASIKLSIEGTELASVSSNEEGVYEYTADEDLAGQTLEFIIEKKGFIKKNISSEIDRLEIKSDILIDEIEIEIKGKICDKADRPLADASISFRIGDKTIKLISDKDGSFSFTTGQQFLNQRIGYEASKEGFKVKSGKLELIEDLKCINLDPISVPFWNKNKVAVVLIALTGLAIVAFALPHVIDILSDESPELSMDPVPVIFNFRPETGDQTILISNKGHGTLEWEVHSDQDWIVVSPESGTDSSTVTVSVNVDGMSPGSHTGKIIVDSNGGTMIGSIFLYIPPSDELKIHDFSAEPESMDVAGNTKLNWHVSDDASITIDGIGPVDESTGSIEKWVSEDTTFIIRATNKAGISDVKSITVTVGIEPTDLVEIKYFTANPYQISIGEESILSWDVSGVDSVTIEPEIGTKGYTGEEKVSPDESTTYTLTATNEAGISDVRTVTLTFEVEMPELSVNPDPLDLDYGTMNEGNTDSRTFSILNNGSGTLEWNISTDQSWITVSPTSGTNSGEVTVTVNTAGLSLGNYSGTITIDSNGGEPKQVNMNLIVSSEQPTVGSIHVTSTPSGAYIDLDGSYEGTTPKTFSGVPVGSHTIKVTASGYEDHQQEVTVTAGETASISVNLVKQTGSIYVTSIPSGADIYLDGSYEGTTPKTISKVSEGSHTIKVTAGGYEEVSKGVAVTVGETASVSVELEIGEIPLPKLVFIGSEEYEVRGNQFIRYRLSVENWEEFPTILFESAPDLPPCGLNTEASRTWVNIYNAEDDRRLYGFCGFSSPKSLTSLWFAVQKDVTPPEAVYIQLVDRRENKIYSSNKVTIRRVVIGERIIYPTIGKVLI